MHFIGFILFLIIWFVGWFIYDVFQIYEKDKPRYRNSYTYRIKNKEDVISGIKTLLLTSLVIVILFLSIHFK